MNKPTKIILFATLGIVFTVAFFMIVTSFFSGANPVIIFLIYVLFLFIIFGPFLPTDKKTKTSFVERVGGKFRESESKSNDALKFKLRWKLKLSEEYQTPLVMKCRCGFLLTSRMKKCPQCNKLNPDYIESSSKANHSLFQ